MLCRHNLRTTGLILYWKSLLQFHKIGTLEVALYISLQAVQYFAQIFNIVKLYFVILHSE
jgi:hypothetical protein